MPERRLPRRRDGVLEHATRQVIVAYRSLLPIVLERTSLAIRSGGPAFGQPWPHLHDLWGGSPRRRKTASIDPIDLQLDQALRREQQQGVFA